mgnify:CR=1 FL=1
MYKTNQWLDRQAKTLETKILNLRGESPAWSTLSDWLLKGMDRQDNALMEIKMQSGTDNSVLVIDEIKYKEHKRDIKIKYLGGE